MMDAVGRPRSVLVLGGSSDIGVAIAERFARDSPGLAVTLAARPSPSRSAAADRLRGQGCVVSTLDFDALDDDAHDSVVRRAAETVDVDVAVVAYGVLGDAEQAWQDPVEAARVASVNYRATVLTGVALGQLVRRQGHGVVVALSSVAGERPRRSNFVYGSSKAGFDAFFTGLGEALRPLGGRVVVVRPGFVHSAMTRGLDAAPLAVGPQEVADAAVAAVAAGREQVWVPGAMRLVMSGLRHVPRPLFRRLPL